jgi:hypothetical protein
MCTKNCTSILLLLLLSQLGAGDWTEQFAPMDVLSQFGFLQFEVSSSVCWLVQRLHLFGSSFLVIPIIYFF